MAKRIVGLIILLAGLAWTFLLPVALLFASYAHCFMKERCHLPWGGYIAIIAVYGAGLLAGRFLTRLALRSLEARAARRRDGTL